MRAALQSGPAKIGIISAAALVVANMIGTGVFTSLGLQLAGISQPLAVLLLWGLGAAAALCGAMVYGELGAMLPRSGGEYQYLAKAYNPALGFLAGWVSVLIGFPAPGALSAMAFGFYFFAVLPVAAPENLAICVLAAVTCIHACGLRPGISFQNFFSGLNILLIFFFIVCGLFFAQKNVPVSLAVNTDLIRDITSPGFAVSLVYVTYAFSGWNAAAYVAGEIKNPGKNLPIALFAGTGLVTVLYLLLNYTFLSTGTIHELAGRIHVGYISAGNIFGPRGRDILGLIISVLMISSLSSYVFVGPRISQAMGEDYRLLRLFAIRTRGGVPLASLLLQFLLSLVLIKTASFEAVLTYAGFALNLCTFLTVFGVFVCRRRYPDLHRPYKTWGYPAVPIIYLLIMGWNLVYLLIERPLACVAGLTIMTLALALYWISLRYQRLQPTPE